MNKYIKKILPIIIVSIWIAFSITFGLGLYVNWYLPHGPSYSTGEFNCINDGRGPCHEEYIEDLQQANIPEWAKFFRRSESGLLLFSLLFLGIVLPNYYKTNK